MKTVTQVLIQLSDHFGSQVCGAVELNWLILRGVSNILLTSFISVREEFRAWLLYWTALVLSRCTLPNKLAINVILAFVPLYLAAVRYRWATLSILKLSRIK